MANEFPAFRIVAEPMPDGVPDPKEPVPAYPHSHAVTDLRLPLAGFFNCAR
jgi:hypothetical protein